MVRRVRRGSTGPQNQVCYFKNFYVAVMNSYDEMDKFGANYKGAEVKVPNDFKNMDLGTVTAKTDGEDRALNDDNRIFDLLFDFRQSEARGAIELTNITIKVSPNLYTKLQAYDLLVE